MIYKKYLLTIYHTIYHTTYHTIYHTISIEATFIDYSETMHVKFETSLDSIGVT